MKDAVIVMVRRTPVGKIKQSLSRFTAVELAAMAAADCVKQAGIDPGSIDEVIMGNLFNHDQANMARYAVLQADFPITVPGITIDRQCSSSLNAVAYGALLVQTGNADIVLAGGVESYSQRPIMIQNPPDAFPGTLKVLPFQSVPTPMMQTMIQTAENLAKEYGITREECDEFALMSHQKAARAWNEGVFADQVFPVAVPQRKGPPVEFAVDECVRFDASLESMAKLKPVFEGGVVTAGNASPMNDGASMVLVMSAEKAAELGLEPLARVTAFASAGVRPQIMGIGPVAATRKLFKNTGLTVDDIDLFELNEAFAAQSLACIRDLKLPLDRLNVNGGAIAIGHPNAASGGILVGRLVHEMKRRDAKRGLISFCCGGGQGFTVLFER